VLETKRHLIEDVTASRVLRRLNNGLIVTEGPMRSFSVDSTELVGEAVELLKEVIILSLTGAGVHRPSPLKYSQEQFWGFWEHLTSGPRDVSGDTPSCPATSPSPI
jgi:hypothetical protein